LDGKAKRDAWTLPETEKAGGGREGSALAPAAVACEWNTPCCCCC